MLSALSVDQFLAVLRLYEIFDLVQGMNEVEVQKKYK